MIDGLTVLLIIVMWIDLRHEIDGGRKHYE